MITSILKTALSTAGCSLILYESDKLAGVITDQSKQNDVIGLILQPNSMTFEIKANGVYHHYPPIIVEVMKQVKPEDTAENNESTFTALVDICDKFINALIKTQKFKKITSINASKIQENRYDANVIGWALPLDLFHNESNNHC
jgi:hypothetical protein